jgi:integrase
VLHSKSVSALKPESARKVRTLLHAVFDKAVEVGALDVNPMSSDRLRTLMAAGRQTRPPAVDLHRGALRPEEMPEFFAELVEVIARSEEMRKSSASAKALAFCILTASRSGNVLAAEWDEFDFEAHTWTIPAWKMKMTANGAHVVYLSEQAEALAKSSASGKARRYVFASALGGIMSGQGAPLRTLLQRMNAGRRERGLPEWIDTEQTRDTGEKTKISPHGISRATFKTWTQTATNPATGQRFIPEAAELCLHHRLAGAGGLGRAYERNDFEQERRDMAAAWARFCLSKTAPERWEIAIG